MTQHPRTLAEAAALEVEAARRNGLYGATWDTKARSQNNAAQEDRRKAKRHAACRLYLGALADGDLTIAGLARAIGRTPSAASQQSKIIEAEGLLRRYSLGDRSWAAITPAGRAWLAEHDSAGGEA
ncbi:hypothetical protein C4N9_20835 [Pararhodobacter marinus]|uniref:MarR family transcriptional regulator n=1 Tax=Pararhodobacter marinus TaxID=2184063 RepID=A0A2U2C4D7_9RHOB|nr:hypothetical protein [Pararhodobacter marinus]PWE26709.1 hypothetical protein C4N9_20835 [Pararhodobacter marinus]